MTPGYRALIAFTPSDLAQIRRYLSDHADVLRDSFKEADGHLRDPRILREVAALRLARELMTKRNLRPSAIRENPCPSVANKNGRTP